MAYPLSINNTTQDFSIGAYKSQINDINNRIESLKQKYNIELNQLLQEREAIAQNLINYKKQFDDLETLLNIPKDTRYGGKKDYKGSVAFRNESERILDINQKPMHMNELMRLQNIDIIANKDKCYARLKADKNFKSLGLGMWGLSKWPEVMK